MKYDVNPSDPHEGALLDDEGAIICTLHVPAPAAERVGKHLVETRDCLAEAIKVIEDFMPNIGRCVLQDYGRLNDVLCTSARLFREQP